MRMVNYAAHSACLLKNVEENLMTVEKLIEILGEQDPQAEVTIYTSSSQFLDTVEVRCRPGLVIIDASH